MDLRNLKELTTMGLRPGNFKGQNGEDPERFLGKFDRLAAYGEWDDEKKLGVFPLLLDDKAYDFYEASPRQVKTNYDRLKTAFLAHFEPNKSKLVRWNELCQKSITVGQSISEYHDEIRKDASKIGGITEEQLMIVFLNGLPTEIKEHVALQQPKSLAEALKKARFFESIKAESKEKKSLIETLAVERNANEELNELKNEVTVLRDEVMALRFQNAELRQKDTPNQGGFQNVRNGIYLPSSRWKTNSTSTNTGNDNNKLSPNVERRTCYYCRIKGHLKRDCYKYKREHPQGPPPQSSKNPSATEIFHREGARQHVMLQPDMTMAGYLNGMEASYLVDSGSALTLCSEAYYERMHPKPLLHNSAYIGIVSVNGEEAELSGTIQAEISLGEFKTTMDLEVLKGMSYDVVLGRDFLRKHVERISWPDCQLEFQHNQTCAVSDKTSRGETVDHCKGRLVESLRLAPGEEKDVLIYPDQNILSYWIKISKLERKTLPKNIEIEPKKQSGLEGEIPCTIRNTSESVWVSLKRDTPIAKIRPVELAKTSILKVQTVANSIEDVSRSSHRRNYTNQRLKKSTDRDVGRIDTSYSLGNNYSHRNTTNHSRRSDTNFSWGRKGNTCGLGKRRVFISTDQREESLDRCKRK